MILIGPWIFSRIYDNVFEINLEGNNLIYASAYERNPFVVLREIKGGIGNNYREVVFANRKMRLTFEGFVGLIPGITYMLTKSANSHECLFELGDEYQSSSYESQTASYSLFDLESYVNHRRNRTGMVTAGIFLLLTLSAQKGHLNNLLTYDGSNR